MILFLKILFYLTIAVPFIYMISDVFVHVVKGTYQIYSKRLKPVIILAITRH